MNIDKNEFFRKAAVLICRHLDIETSLYSLFGFLINYVPVRELFLNIFEEGFGAIRTIASAAEQGGKKLNRLTYLNEEAREYMEYGQQYAIKHGKIKAQVINQPSTHKVSRFMVDDFDTPDTSLLVLSLIMDSQIVGNLVLEGEGTDLFTREQAELISLLNEPMAISLSNAKKHNKIVELKNRLDDDNQYLRTRLSKTADNKIIGKDFGLKLVMKRAEQVAPLDSPVLLLGETGTGKELMAEMIHSNSNRRDKDFVTINCGAIPETLMDSELFGHEKGAFTGASAKKRGHFERADGGTIFLDEIGELPLHAQVRLLRVLQNQEIQRVGSDKIISVNIRIIAATHRNLEKMVETGKFRHDLWFRLNVFPVTLPPLRKRANDIPELVNYFLGKKSKTLNIKNPNAVEEGAMDLLMRYQWPGNIRELENVVERALILHEKGKLSFSKLIKIDDSPEPFLSTTPAESVDTLDQVVKNHLISALRAANGKIHGKRGAAELIKVNPNTFRSKMRKYGIGFKSYK